MALAPIIPAAIFPNVPNLPGVPQMARSPLFPPTPNPTLGSQGIPGSLWQSSRATPTWGILNNANQPVVVPDSFLSFDNRNEWRVVDYPVQDGAFASYNKVIVPFELSVRLSKGGSQSDRSTFLASIDAIAGDFNLYTILTPERTYRNCNITRYEVTRRGANGAFFLTEVDIYFRQIRQVAAQYSTTAAPTQNAQQPSAVGAINNGTVQPSAVPQEDVAKVQASVAGVTQ